MGSTKRELMFELKQLLRAVKQIRKLIILSDFDEKDINLLESKVTELKSR